ncbi:hypothetical protein PT974_05772 [Cladobotryum mycophilum]|uniref:Transcription factor TFIIIC triple barrel domain-containing protein n=1 Tax=Cladobotryum mycophilum TaxID=491253 RepID=A0ABR0SJP7_9HYPO
MTPSTAAREGVRVDEPAALGLDKILQQVAENDEEEWEYEYSTTETETYYLTLELSYPEFKDRPAKAPHYSRGGYYKNWLDQYSDNPAVKTTTFGLGQEDQSENENDNENENENDDEPIPEPDADDDMQHLDPMLRPSPPRQNDQPQKKDGKGKEKEGEEEQEQPQKDDKDKDEDKDADDEEMEEIQILNLHSHSPIISYRGRVFEGQWAEVIGTEAIFANHEDGSPHPLPALRQLPGDVDILGASSSRILTTEKIPKPRVPVEDSLAAIRKEWNIRIPPGKDRTGERAQQIRFLENLIALKKKKGQADEVTVYAVDGEGKDFNDKRGPDFKPRKRRPAVNSKLSEDGSQSGRRDRRRSGRSGRQSARRLRRAGKGTYAGNTGRSPTLGPNTLSTPTPSHWDDLSTRGDEEAEEDYEDEDNENDSLDSISEESDGPTHDDDDGDEEDVTMDG